MKPFRSGTGLLLFLVAPLVAVLIAPALVCYPQGTGNLDNSWKWSLGYAAQNHLQWGTDYILTYGPLGYLDAAVYYGSYKLWWISALFAVICYALYLQVLTLFSLKSSKGPVAWIGKLLLCVLLILGGRYSPQMLLFLVPYGFLCLSLIEETSIGLALLTAFLLSVSSLIKETALFGAGALLIANLIACFLLQDRRKMAHALASLAAFPLFFLLLWLGCGQSPAHLPAYFRGVTEMAAGYNVMEMDGYAYQVILALLLMASYVFAIARLWRQSRMAVALFLISGPVFLLYWKEGFVRHDPVPWGAHELTFFTAAFFIFWVHYSLTGDLFPRMQKLFLGGAILCLLYVFPPACLFRGTPGPPGTQAYLALNHANFTRHEQAQQEISSGLRSSYRLPTALTSQLEPVPTMICPWDLVLAPAYGLPLALPPVPQQYTIYTSYLDHVEAIWLNKSLPPQILYSYIAIDGRYPLFEAPEFSYDILRQYEVVASTRDYAVMRLRQSAEPPPIVWQDSTLTGHFDEEIALPEADAGKYVLLKVRMRRSFPGEIAGFFYKTTSPQIVFHLKDGTSPSHRFVHKTGEDGLLVSHCVENMEEYVRLNKRDWPPNVRSISFHIDRYSAWQFADSFQLQFGTSDIEPPTRSESRE